MPSRPPCPPPTQRRIIEPCLSADASAVGTTVLQVTEIPPRPARFDGALSLFGCPADVGETTIRAALGKFGTIVDCVRDGDGATVVFETHAAALAAKRVAHELAHLCAGIDTQYNERSYDGRTGEAGRDDDDGRGWCCFEASISGELIARLSVYPKMRSALESLPPKLLRVSADTPSEPIEVGALAGRVEAKVARIDAATFTGKADKPIVVSLYKEYVVRIARVLATTLASQESAHVKALVPALPEVDIPAALPLLLAPGQVVLVRSNVVGWQFGVVADDSSRVALPLAASAAFATLSFDRCDQAVVPWRPSLVSSGALEALVRDVGALRTTVEMARRLSERTLAPGTAMEADVRALTSEAESVLAPASGALRAVADAAHRVLVQATDAAVEAIAQRDRAGLAREGAHVEVVARAFQQLRSAVQGLHPEALAAAALCTSGACGARWYAQGQWLTLYGASGEWEDVQVASQALALHPWNHAPRELPHNAFEAMRTSWVGAMRGQHAHIIDALSGQTLDALQQCVAIDVQGAIALASADAFGLSEWLAAQHAERVQGGACEAPCAALLTAPPAAGKTTLLSQLVALALGSGELVPIVIKVQQLQRRLLDDPHAFAAAWNYVDAYLRLEHGEGAVYRFLRQAMAARRALVLIDGLDEGGQRRDEIEAHVADVLAPQGHVLLCTSRPAGLDVAGRFGAFRHLSLAPLTEAQQQAALEQRLGAERAAGLLPYVRDTVPTDTETGEKATSNPLMLSMVASVFELRQGIGMPQTVSELYNIAAEAMLARGGAATPQLTALLQRVFFEAHVAQRRVIEDRQLDEAALGMEAPDELRAIRAAHDPFAHEGRAEKGHYVEVLAGKHAGKCGVITKDDHSSHPYRVTVDGEEGDWLTPDQLRSSGVDEAQFGERAEERLRASATAVHAACEAKLSHAMHEALRTVRERVKRDELPLLSLLQAEPLQMQASHLSFQEYFAARALCEEGTALSGAPPWQWPAWWANAVKLGEEMGEPFARGLLRAAGVEGDALDLQQKLGGDRPTVLRVLCVLLAMGSVTKILVGENQLGEVGTKAICDALRANTTVKELDLSGSTNRIGGQSNIGGPAGAKHVADMLGVNGSITSVRWTPGYEPSSVHAACLVLDICLC